MATLYLGTTDYWPYKLVLAGQDRKVPLDNRRRGLNGEPIGSLSSIEKVAEHPGRADLLQRQVQ